jgi:hypothetical protein
MDGHKFDDLVRAMATASSRRGLAKAALAALAGIAIGVSDDAAGQEGNPCQVCKQNGTCRKVRDGTACGRCRACSNGACSQAPAGTSCGQCGECNGGGGCDPKPSACGVCTYCETSTMTCNPNPGGEGQPCGSCGVCSGGTCNARLPSGCKECERCQKKSDGSRSCESKCDRGKRCCPDGDCVGADECCPELEQRCPVDQECCTTDCCNGECCRDDQACVNGSLCCRENSICPIPGTNQVRCCENQVCCPSSGQCATSGEECCRACDPCQSCDPETGECVDTDDKEGQRCEKEGVTGPCGGKCQNSRCDPIKVNELCLDNTICCDSGCCSSRQQACCGGQCCDGDCCEGACCQWLCVPGIGCCPTPFFAAPDVLLVAAAGGMFCCPFGPPCGEGAGARCCAETEQCCGGTCCAADQECCGDGCCAEGESCCGTTCCPGGGTCCAGIWCDGGQECCDGFCKDSCDNPCGAPDLYLCQEGQCCHDGELCCPGNTTTPECAEPGSTCCQAGTFQCETTCCDANAYRYCGTLPFATPNTCCVTPGCIGGS